VAFGMGGALLAQVHRDTQKFAMKCSHIFVNGESRKVFKDPITDPGKKSKYGRLDLVEWSNGMFQTVNIPDDKISNEFSIMRTVYENGELLIDDNFETIRQRTKN
jgi:nicotinamide phosphoribosyltransferase